MKKVKWLVKVLEEGYALKYKQDSDHKPRGGKYIVLDGPDIERDAAEVIEVDGELVVALNTIMDDDVKRKKNRRREYPSIEDQLEAIYKTFKFLKKKGIDLGVDGDKYLKKIDNIKVKYPKNKKK